MRFYSTFHAEVDAMFDSTVLILLTVGSIISAESPQLLPEYERTGGILTKKNFYQEARAVPNYSYNYEVKDPYSGDKKSQHEVRKGNTVQGSYSVVDPDGYRRIVEYFADSVTGFNAIVTKEKIPNYHNYNDNNIYSF